MSWKEVFIKAGLDQENAEQVSAGFSKHSPNSMSCPKCRFQLVYAKLHDERNVRYCKKCRVTLPA